MTRTTAQTIAANTTAYLPVGPIPTDSLIVGLTLTLAHSAANAIIAAPTIGAAPTANAANHAAGRPLIDNSNATLNGVNSMTVYVPQSGTTSVTLAMDLPVSSGPAWIIIAIQNTNGLSVMAAIAQVRAIPRPTQSSRLKPPIERPRISSSPEITPTPQFPRPIVPVTIGGTLAPSPLP